MTCMCCHKQSTQLEIRLGLHFELSLSLDNDGMSTADISFQAKIYAERRLHLAAGEDFIPP